MVAGQVGQLDGLVGAGHDAVAELVGAALRGGIPGGRVIDVPALEVEAVARGGLDGHVVGPLGVGRDRVGGRQGHGVGGVVGSGDAAVVGERVGLLAEVRQVGARLGRFDGGADLIAVGVLERGLVGIALLVPVLELIARAGTGGGTLDGVALVVDGVAGVVDAAPGAAVGLAVGIDTVFDLDPLELEDRVEGHGPAVGELGHLEGVVAAGQVGGAAGLGAPAHEGVALAVERLGVEQGRLLARLDGLLVGVAGHGVRDGREVGVRAVLGHGHLVGEDERAGLRLEEGDELPVLVDGGRHRARGVAGHGRGAVVHVGVIGEVIGPGAGLGVEGAPAHEGPAVGGVGVAVVLAVGGGGVLGALDAVGDGGPQRVVRLLGELDLGVVVGAVLEGAVRAARVLDVVGLAPDGAELHVVGDGVAQRVADADLAVVADGGVLDAVDPDFPAGQRDRVAVGVVGDAQADQALGVAGRDGGLDRVVLVHGVAARGLGDRAAVRVGAVGEVDLVLDPLPGADVGDGVGAHGGLDIAIGHAAVVRAQVPAGELPALERRGGGHGVLLPRLLGGRGRQQRGAVRGGLVLRVVARAHIAVGDIVRIGSVVETEDAGGLLIVGLAGVGFAGRAGFAVRRGADGAVVGVTREVLRDGVERVAVAGGAGGLGLDPAVGLGRGVRVLLVVLDGDVHGAGAHEAGLEDDGVPDVRGVARQPELLGGQGGVAAVGVGAGEGGHIGAGGHVVPRGTVVQGVGPLLEVVVGLGDGGDRGDGGGVGGVALNVAGGRAGVAVAVGGGPLDLRLHVGPLGVGIDLRIRSGRGAQGSLEGGVELVLATVGLLHIPAVELLARAGGVGGGQRRVGGLPGVAVGGAVGGGAVLVGAEDDVVGALDVIDVVVVGRAGLRYRQTHLFGSDMLLRAAENGDVVVEAVPVVATIRGCRVGLSMLDDGTDSRGGGRCMRFPVVLVAIAVNEDVLELPGHDRLPVGGEGDVPPAGDAVHDRLDAGGGMVGVDLAPGLGAAGRLIGHGPAVELVAGPLGDVAGAARLVGLEEVVVLVVLEAGGGVVGRVAAVVEDVLHGEGLGLPLGDEGHDALVGEVLGDLAVGLVVADEGAAVVPRVGAVVPLHRPALEVVAGAGGIGRGLEGADRVAPLDAVLGGVGRRGGVGRIDVEVDGVGLLGEVGIDGQRLGVLVLDSLGVVPDQVEVLAGVGHGDAVRRVDVPLVEGVARDGRTLVTRGVGQDVGGPNHGLALLPAGVGGCAVLVLDREASNGVDREVRIEVDAVHHLEVVDAAQVRGAVGLVAGVGALEPAREHIAQGHVNLDGAGGNLFAIQYGDVVLGTRAGRAGLDGGTLAGGGTGAVVVLARRMEGHDVGLLGEVRVVGAAGGVDAGLGGQVEHGRVERGLGGVEVVGRLGRVVDLPALEFVGVAVGGLSLVLGRTVVLHGIDRVGGAGDGAAAGALGVEHIGEGHGLLVEDGIEGDFGGAEADLGVGGVVLGGAAVGDGPAHERVAGGHGHGHEVGQVDLFVGVVAIGAGLLAVGAAGGGGVRDGDAVGAGVLGMVVAHGARVVDGHLDGQGLPVGDQGDAALAQGHAGGIGVAVDVEGVGTVVALMVAVLLGLAADLPVVELPAGRGLGLVVLDHTGAVDGVEEGVRVGRGAAGQRGGAGLA